MAKVLFLYPNFLRYNFIPIGLASIMAVVREIGANLHLCDLTFLDDREVVPTFRNQLAAIAPDILAIHCSSADWPLVDVVLKSVGDLLNQNTLVVLGGPHATALPEQVIASTNIDVVLIGEGEEAFRQLLDNIISGRDVTKTPNCWAKFNGKIVKNELVHLCKDLDSLLMPAWELFDERHLLASPDGGRTIRREGGIETSRGCPHSCSYCFTARMRRLYQRKGKFCRQKSVERIVYESKYIRDRLRLDFLHLIDDNFINSQPRLEALAPVFRKEVGLPFFAQVSADKITPISAKYLSEMGAEYVGIGVEVGDDVYRRKMLKKRVTNDQIINAFKLIRDTGMKPWAYYMIGLPYQTVEQLDATVRLDRQLRPDKAFVSIYYPFPGTLLFDQVMAKLDIPNAENGPDYFSGIATNNVSGLPSAVVESYRQHFPHAYRRNDSSQMRDLIVVGTPDHNLIS